jgi:CRISPR/Cas system-associated exonuclease Cas4 (RecB family)
MSNPGPVFAWIVDDRREWPPRGRPSAPYSMTQLEVMRACPLRACFDRSPGYARRMDAVARIGSAFHTALQWLNKRAPEGISANEAMEQARQQFHIALAEQERKRAEQPREHGLSLDSPRVDMAIEALIAEAQRISQADEQVRRRGSGRGGIAHAPRSDGTLVEAEAPVASKDRLFEGRVDRVEHRPNGVHIVDYKSAIRDDLPGRYERQVQLYALLWHETRGDWPVSAEVVYPFTGRRISVSVDPERCAAIDRDYRQMVETFKTTENASELAKPGDICQVCEFRPWCRPFWAWQEAETNHRQALERARVGFEGTVTDLRTVSQHIKAVVRWRGVGVEIIAPQDRFPQLKGATVGIRVRALDMELQGMQYAPRARVTAYSELYLVNAA